MPRDSAAANRPASYLVGTAAAFLLFFRDRTKPINQLPFSPSAKFPKSGSSCESRVKHLQLLVVITLCSVSQVTIWRVFIAQIKINQAGEGAVEYWRRPLIGKPGLHFCPFRTAPLGERVMVMGIDIELND